MTFRPAERSVTGNPTQFSVDLPAPDYASAPDDSDEDAFDRFEALARKLVRVPKDEVDAERAKEKGRKG